VTSNGDSRWFTVLGRDRDAPEVQTNGPPGDAADLVVAEPNHRRRASVHSTRPRQLVKQMGSMSLRSKYLRPLPQPVTAARFVVAGVRGVQPRRGTAAKITLPVELLH